MTFVNNPSDDDLKQMFVYNLLWNAEKTLLLYPKINQIDSKFGIFHFDNLGNKCKLGLVDITKEQSIKNNQNIAYEIFDKLRF